MQRLLAILSIFVFLFVFSRPMLGQKDSLLGTWVLNRGSSDFMPENETLQSRTMFFEAAENGVKCTITTVNEAGNGRTTIDNTYLARYDGKDVPIDSSALDTVALKRIDANSVERIGKIRGKRVETATMKISADGKVLTVTTMGSIDGRDYRSTQIFERQ